MGQEKYFDRTRFDADLMRIQVFYADRGYPDARVTSFDVKLNSKQDEVDVTLTVSEGEPIRTARVNFNGFAVIPPEHFRTMQQSIPLKIGEPRDRQQVVATQELALNELRDHGYPYARVAIDERLGGTAGKDADITFNAQAGQMAYFGPIAIAGNRSVSERVIERELPYHPGDLYRRSLVQDTQRRLYRMELFQFVSVQPAEIDRQPTEVPTRVTVAEGNHQRTTFGFGYGSEEKSRVDAEYRHVNFLGGARTAAAHGRWSSLDRGIRLDLTQPYFLAPHFSLGGSGQDWYTYTPAYRSHIVGGRLALTHRANASTSWSVSMMSERDASTISSKVLTDPKLRNNLIALGLDPSTVSQQGTRDGARFRPAALHRRQPAGCAPRLPDDVSRRAGGTVPARHVQPTGWCSPTGAITCRSADRSSGPTARRWATSVRRTATRRLCRSRRSISSAARPRFAAGGGTR